MAILATWKRQHWALKLLIILIVGMVLAGIGLLTGVEGSSNSPGIPAAAAATANDPAVDFDNGNVVVTEENIIDPSIILAGAENTGLLPAIFRTSAGCHGRVWRRLYIKQPITGFTYGWRQTAVNQWCWNTAGTMTTAGTASGNDGAYSNFSCCWSDVDYGRAWWNVSHTEAKVWNRGTLKVCGRVVPGTRVLYPQVFYHAPDARRPYAHWNYGDPTKVYR